MYGRKLDPIVHQYRLESAEKRIPVRCDRDIAVRTRQRSSRYMPRSEDQEIGLNALEDYHRNTDPRNIKLADNVAFTKTCRFVEGGRFTQFGSGSALRHVSRFRAHAGAFELPRLVLLIDAGIRGRAARANQ
jgi:hypothetical protein